jgi:2-polyprenyl-6-hydroxyphenyl methylase/3-demethylubiquinone-9 3-methyltransferase
VLNLLPKGTHEFAKFIKPSELAQHCRAAGLNLQASKGLQYNPITRRYWLDGNTSVNYMMGTQRG